MKQVEQREKDAQCGLHYSMNLRENEDSVYLGSEERNTWRMLADKNVFKDKKLILMRNRCEIEVVFAQFTTFTLK